MISKFLTRHVDFVTLIPINIRLQHHTIGEQRLAALAERHDVIVLVAEGAVAPAQHVQDRVADLVVLPALGVAIWDADRLIPASILLRPRENTL